MRRRWPPLAILLHMIGNIIGRRAVAPPLTSVRPSDNGPARWGSRGGVAQHSASSECSSAIGAASGAQHYMASNALVGCIAALRSRPCRPFQALGLLGGQAGRQRFACRSVGARRGAGQGARTSWASPRPTSAALWRGVGGMSEPMCIVRKRRLSLPRSASDAEDEVGAGATAIRRKLAGWTFRIWPR
jgi:hypothetical protein